MEQRTEWVTTKVVKGMKANKVSEDILAQWLIACLGQKYTKAFSNTAKDIGMPVKIEVFTL